MSLCKNYLLFRCQIRAIDIYYQSFFIPNTTKFSNVAGIFFRYVYLFGEIYTRQSNLCILLSNFIYNRIFT